MRILILTPFSTPVRGGPSRFVEGVSRELRSHSVDVHAVTMDGSEDVHTTAIRGNLIQRVLLIIRLLLEMRPDVVHVQGHWLLLASGVACRLARRRSRLIFTFHTATYLRGFKRLGFAFLLNRCDAVTAVSGDLLAEMGRQYGMQVPNSVTYPGADLPSLAMQNQSAPDREDRQEVANVTLVAVCPLHYPRKVEGLMDLVRALPSVARAQPGVRLVLVGDGVYRGAIERLVLELNIADRVTFLGDIEKPGDVMADADIVCHISYQDGLPLAVLEAMALAKPLICSPVGGIPEIIRDGEDGLLVAGGPGPVADAIISLIGDERLRRILGQRARQKIERLFTWRHCLNRLMPLYQLPAPKRIHFSVDLEEDYLLGGPSYRGVLEAFPRLLELFRTHRVSASIFVTVDVASKFPGIVRKISSEGHTLGLHGVSHADSSFAGADQIDQTRRLALSRHTLESVGGLPQSFRAPNFWADSSTVHALQSLGFQSDSSVVTGRFVRRSSRAPRIDFRGAPVQSYRLSREAVTRIGRSALIEVPIVPNPFVKGSPIGLGLLNWAGLETTKQATDKAPSSDVIFLIHPWEAIDYPAEVKTPAWMHEGCTANLNLLGSFLDWAKIAHTIVPFVELSNSFVEPNPSWWSPGPWGELVPRPKVLVVHEESPNSVTPAKTACLSLVGGIQAQGFEVELLFRGRTSDPSSKGGEVRMSHVRTRPGFVLVSLFKVLRERVRSGRVIVHTSGSGNSLWMVGLVAKLLGSVVLRSVSSSFQNSRLSSRFLRKLDAVVVSMDLPSTNPGGLTAYPHDRIVVVPEQLYATSGAFVCRIYAALWATSGSGDPRIGRLRLDTARHSPRPFARKGTSP